MGSGGLGKSDYCSGLELSMREKAIERALELKSQHFTVKEIVLKLEEEGYVVTDSKRSMGKPFGFYAVGEWCRGKNKQTGKKDRSLSEEERKEHRRQSKLKARREWYARNKEELREGHAAVMRELRSYYSSMGVKYWKKGL